MCRRDAATDAEREGIGPPKVARVGRLLPQCRRLPDIHDNRSLKAANELLDAYNGTIVADGFGLHGSLAKRAGHFTLANCWVHARRRYHQTAKFFPKAGEMLYLSGALYEIEGQCRGPPDDEERLVVIHAPAPV